jgi:Fe2+ transport system protein FeoA
MKGSPFRAAVREKEAALHLGELERGQRATVIGVAQGEAFCHLCSLGLSSGAEVEIVRTLSRKTLLIVRVDGSDIALRKDAASTVKIRAAEHLV